MNDNSTNMVGEAPISSAVQEQGMTSEPLPGDSIF